MTKCLKFFSFVLITGLMCSAQAFAKLPVGAAAVVNGVTISEVVVNESVKANLARGQQDTPQLRKAVIDGLISRELMVQDAVKQGLDNTPEAKQQLIQLRQILLVELALNNNLKKRPITDQAVKGEYDRQVAELGNTSSLQEYKLAIIVVPTEKDIKAIAATLKKGEAFAKIAQDKSIDPSKSQGGNLGWVLNRNFIPQVATAINNLAKNSNLTAPVEVPAGWMIVQVEDKRNFKVPTFEASQEAIRVALTQKEQTNYLSALKTSAAIAE